MLLGWMEHLGKDERPPRWMWALDEPVDEWFQEVERKRDEKYGRSPSSEANEAGWEQNELTKGLRR